jgi:2-polyprenyl-3-methyl-5-hydroxy-6-metoxy-1,4-benzoquinol methylase
VEDKVLSLRDQAEVNRSSLEAKRITLKPVSDSELARYVSPPSNTPFVLEYAFHLLGDVNGKTVLDLGCGTGINLIPLTKRGARTIGIDISPDLIRLAQKRLDDAQLESTLQVGSAYDTGLPDESVDVIYCMSLIHHLEIPRVRDEMRRVLVPGGRIILKEPIRFSSTYTRLRKLLPAHGEEVSDFEHPLTQEELATMTESFRVEGVRHFRLPIVPLMNMVLPSASRSLWKTDYHLLKRYPALERYATTVVMRLIK